MLAKEIEDKAFALNAGQHTQPIRTKQGFIILQATQHQLGGDASFKQVEPQVEEALFLERMQPALRVYLTKLREEAYIELKPGVVDTGASGNEMRLTYSAYTPPAEKKKKKFARARFRGRQTSTAASKQTAAQTSGAATPGPTTAGTTTSGAATAGSTTPSAATPGAATAVTTTTGAKTADASTATTQQASNSDQKVQKPGKKEKIRFGQAPRESLPTSQVATASVPAVGPDTTPTVTTPETRYVNPDGTISGAAASAPDRKTRLSNRPPVKKVKKDKSGSDTDTSSQPTPEELASQKVQNAPLGLADQTAAQKKAKAKGEKTRYADKPKEPDQTPAPYLGKPANADTQPPAPTTSQPAPATSQPAPATGPPGATPPPAQQP
jgi:peptidyl-prolyl cis-trans isomerase SurA